MKLRIAATAGAIAVCLAFVLFYFPRGNNPKPDPYRSNRVHKNGQGENPQMSTLSSSSVGEIKYIKVLEDYCPFQLLAKAGRIPQETADKQALESPSADLDVFLGPDDTILHIERVVNRNASISRDSYVKELMRTRDGIEIEEVGIDGLTIENSHLINWLVARVAYLTDPDSSLEITPLTIRTTQPSPRSLHAKREVINERLPAVLIKESANLATHGGWRENEKHYAYNFEMHEVVRTTWSLRIITDLIPEEDRERAANIHFHHHGLEVMKSAYEKRKSENNLPKAIWNEGESAPTSVPIDPSFWEAPPETIYNKTEFNKFYPN